jgi:ribosomal protein S18 acetylase RimI-like enzyme
MIEIRYAKVEDADIWTDIILKTWQITYRNVFDKEVFLSREKERDARIERVKNNILSEDNNKILYHAVATKDDKVVGIIVYGKAGQSHDIIDDTYCEVYAIYILQEYQGQGIGTKLIDFAKGDLIRDGYKKLVIWSLEDNPSIDFYRKIGGEVLGDKLFNFYGGTYRGVGFVYDI